ncbi:MAG: helix-turn-helix domain-containing protein [Oscillospiraceae bacterium]|nr:helix-turn-helix domain-containing protein [Oscillospiraceae bacterium]
MITWGDTINIILEMFYTINQQELARLLGVSEGTLSKIKSGKRKAAFKSDTVFESVFNPDNPDSPANDKPCFHLEILKDIIDKPKYEEVRKVMADCWDEKDYKTFVVRLLERTRNNVYDDHVSTSDAAPRQTQVLEQQSDEISSLGLSDNTGTSDAKRPSIRSMFLPHSDDCCYHCVYWKGNRRTLGAYMTSTCGTCNKLSQNQFSADSPCEYFQRRQEQFSADLVCKRLLNHQKLPGDW